MKKIYKVLIIIFILSTFLFIPFLTRDYDKETGELCKYYKGFVPTNCHYPVSRNISLFNFILNR